MKSEIRFTEIDLLRFVAALVVLFFHYTFRGAAADNMSVMAFPALAPVFKYGYLGVDLFFLISGFVILMTALPKSPKEFVISRIARLFPAYWFCCTLTFLAALAMSGGRYPVTFKQYLANLTMLSGMFNIPFVDGVYWSIIIEIKFYSLIFLAVFFKQMERIQYLLGVWLGLSVFLVFFPIRAVAYFLIPDFSAYFIAGAMFYLIHREGPSRYKAGVLAGSFLLILYHARHVMLHNIVKYHAPLEFGVIVGILVLFYAIFFLIVTNRTARFRFDYWILIGNLTYPLYLIHENVGLMLFNLLHDRMNHVLLLMAVITLMFLSAYLIHRWVEKPVGRRLKLWLERFMQRRSRILTGTKGCVVESGVPFGLRNPTMPKILLVSEQVPPSGNMDLQK